MSNNFAYDVIAPVRIVGKDIFPEAGREVIAGTDSTEDCAEADHKTSGKKKIADKICYGGTEKRSCVSLIFRSEFKSVFRCKRQKILIGYQFHCDQSDQNKS